MAEERIPVIRPVKKTPGRGSRKLLFFLFIFFITVLLVLFFQSSISRIARIEVQGNELVASETIGQATGLSPGDHFFGFRSRTVIDRVKALPAVEQASIHKKFPGLIVVEVLEYPRVAFQTGEDGALEAVLSSGLPVRIEPGLTLMVDKPILTGWQPDDPWRDKLCAALARIPDEQLSFLSEITPSPTTSYPDKVKIYTRSQFEIYTTVTYLPDKMSLLSALIEEMKGKKVDSGVFELLEVDVHRPFEVYYGPREVETKGSGEAGSKSPSRSPGTGAETGRSGTGN